VKKRKESTPIGLRRVRRKGILSSAGRPPMEETYSHSLIQVHPTGISISNGVGRPVMIFKDKDDTEVLPVWLQPLDAGVALAELSGTSGLSPHGVTQALLKEINLKLERVVFKELIGNQQYIELFFEDEKPRASRRTSIQVRASEAMSFCLRMKPHFYASRAYMAQCRAIDEDLAKFETSIAQGHYPELNPESDSGSKKHPYVM
jgi:bifunctional DNase/RNase